jgi:hypothetical protein
MVKNITNPPVFPSYETFSVSFPNQIHFIDYNSSVNS